jgi:hypothetical protein
MGIGAAALVGGVAKGLDKGYGAVKERFTKARDYRNMLQAHPALSEHSPGNVQMMYNSLRKLSPTMAKEPLVAGSYVRQMLGASPESGPAVPLQTTKLLAETQQKFDQAKKDRSGGGMFGDYKPTDFAGGPMMAPGLKRMGGQDDQGGRT